jgi:D-alanine-D-alanine ligase-like ATP-grasp enzyme
MLKDLTRDAYLAVGGSGYGRVDIRTNIRDFNDPNFKAFVLEVNA